ncbi:hypothetical protein EST38_g3200 [Candolleomyces aberdarensis]|uniref:Uncharacterized protein n=1 Tax=Candolleomyces aberdarensis TaxID=2316362 RepID=A0A4Q2DQH0_9AGAR|nr:hypothetical protein EST38_g3200 [Candolleomyces aberdarensis]
MSSNGNLISQNSPGVGQEEVYALVAFWLDTLIYGEALEGAYLSLFISSFNGLWRGWRRGASKVFFVGMCLMFLLTTVDALVTAHLNVYAYTWGLSREKGPVEILHAWNRWDRFTHSVMISLVLWIADFLAIYRCYIIWEKNWKVILLPSVLLLLSMRADPAGTNIVNLHWFLHPEKSWLRPTALVFLDMCYPFHLGQNLLTTGLIAFKIWKQHLRSAQSGVRAYTGVTLVYVLRIIFESAMIYTLQMLILVILFQLRHRAMVIFQTSLAPSASIVFVLMITRVERARTRDLGIQASRSTQTIEDAIMKEWPGSSDITLQQSVLLGAWKRRTFSSRVFLGGICVMFLLTTLDAVATAHAHLYAFTGAIAQGKNTIAVLQDLTRWDRYIHVVTVSIVIWIADWLAIYRCYIVWQKSWKVVLVPTIILLLSISTNTVNLYWFLHPEESSLRPTVLLFLDMCYPLHLAQNLLTTGLIAFKIWEQHHRSFKSGVRAYSGITLIYIIRIIIESAMIYTLQMLILVVLFRVRHRAMVIFQTTLAPSASEPPSYLVV